MVKTLAEGDPAPEIELPADGGASFSLAALKGRKVAVYFYPKDDTPGCTAEAIDFSALRDAFAAADTEVVGISTDSARSHDAFKNKHSLGLTLAADEEKNVVQAYGVWGEKSMYGRTFMGVVRSTFLIDRQGRIARIWRKVKVTGHAAEVLKAARALA
ncbi:MAG: peroxiredoxin [Hyphomicrobiales bacterium]|nr:peroxiredoxin [Hyphomicrobiales bacterium]